MNEDIILVSITASKDKGDIVYKVECSSDLSKEEFEYYLDEIIKGVCEWKKDVCKESLNCFEGKINAKKNDA